MPMPDEIVGLLRSTITFKWADGHETRYRARDLRLACRCADVHRGDLRPRAARAGHGPRERRAKRIELDRPVRHLDRVERRPHHRHLQLPRPARELPVRGRARPLATRASGDAQSISRGARSKRARELVDGAEEARMLEEAAFDLCLPGKSTKVSPMIIVSTPCPGTPGSAITSPSTSRTTPAQVPGHRRRATRTTTWFCRRRRVVGEPGGRPGHHHRGGDARGSRSPCRRRCRAPTRRRRDRASAPDGGRQREAPRASRRPLFHDRATAARGAGHRLVFVC